MAQAKSAARKPRRKEKKNIALGQAHIKSTFNNTIVSITDPSGAVISWASSGGVGFKGSRKSTPYAAGMAAESAARQAQEHGVKKVDVFVKGPGSGRETAIRSLTGRRPRGRLDPGRDAAGAQRLPSAEAPPRLMHLPFDRLRDRSLSLSTGHPLVSDASARGIPRSKLNTSPTARVI